MKTETWAQGFVREVSGLLRITPEELKRRLLMSYGYRLRRRDGVWVNPEAESAQEIHCHHLPGFVVAVLAGWEEQNLAKLRSKVV